MQLFSTLRSRGGLRFLCLALVISTGVSALSFAQAQARTSENRKPIRSCAEVGLCQKGKRTMLLDNKRVFSNWAMQYALARGCTLTKQREKKNRIVCPEALSIPYAAPERVFELHDIPSATQVGAIIAQERGFAGDGVVVALIDSGVDTLHPELVGAVQATANFTTEGATDTLGHGTHVAGIVAGQSINDFNGNRVLGVAPRVQLIVAKVCNSQGYCLEGDIDAGVEWAVSQGAKVINMSLGAGSFMGDCDDDPLAQEANWAVDQGALVVAASGNHGDGGEGVASPGCGSKVLSVGAVNVDDQRPSWSGYGSALDIVAPGVGVLSSFPCAALNVCPNPGAVPGNGTSMATPHVTAAAATLLQINPALTPQQLIDMLTSTATDLGTGGFDRFYGFGRLDVNAAVDRALEQQAPPSSSSSVPSSAEQASSQSTSSSSEIPSSVTSSSSSSSSSSVTSTSSMSTTSSVSSSSMSSSSTSRWTSSMVRSSSERSRSETPRPCVPSDWKCSEFHDCGERGMQERECELKNERCTDAERARPPLKRECERRRDEGDRKDDEDHDNGPDRGASGEQGQSSDGNDQRGWREWLRERMR